MTEILSSFKMLHVFLRELCKLKYTAAATFKAVVPKQARQ
jgi:hypothetical protein